MFVERETSPHTQHLLGLQLGLGQGCPEKPGAGKNSECGERVLPQLRRTSGLPASRPPVSEGRACGSQAAVCFFQYPMTSCDVMTMEHEKVDRCAIKNKAYCFSIPHVIV